MRLHPLLANAHLHECLRTTWTTVSSMHILGKKLQGDALECLPVDAHGNVAKMFPSGI